MSAHSLTPSSTRDAMPAAVARLPRPKGLSQALSGAFCVLSLGGVAAWLPVVQAADGGPAAQAQPAGAVRHDIAAGPLESALNQFARAAGVLLTFDAAVLDNRRSAGLNGPYRVEEGFARLLAGSGFEAVRTEGGGYVLRPVPADRTAILPAVNVAASGVGEPASATEGTGSYTAAGPSSTATGLALTLRETPQSLTVVTRQKMDDFNLRTVADVLEQTPGISVTRTGSAVNFSSRGANVNFSTDGHRQIAGGWSYIGSTHHVFDEVADIDRVEVVKGSAGLMNGYGAPGASVNLVRKRPTPDFRAHASVAAGSWRNYQIGADVGGAVNEAGNVRGRVAATASAGDTFRDGERNESKVLFGTVEVDLTPDTLLSAGVTYRDRTYRGMAMWASIPAYRNDVFQGWRPRSFNLGADWSGYEHRSTATYASLAHHFRNGWSVNLKASHESIKVPELLFGNYDTVDKATAGRYKDSRNKNTSFSLDLKGPFELLGRTHEFLIGAGEARSRTSLERSAGLSANNTLLFDHETFDSSWRYAYATGRFELADAVKLILGTRVTDWDDDVKTTSWWNQRRIESGVVTPFAGLVVDVSETISLYGSYANIFEVQSSQDENGIALPPREGLTYEIGAKGEFFDKALNASANYFWMRVDNEAERTGGRTPSGDSAYRAVMGAMRHGYEIELSGAVTPNWQAQGSYTMHSSSLSSADASPRQQFKLANTYRLAGVGPDGLTVGASARWQSGTSAGRIGQGAYWLFDLMARYPIDKHTTLSFNARNVFDKQYFSGLVNDWQGEGYTWGDPRSLNVSLRYDF